MKIYIVTLKDYNEISDRIVKVFSSKDSLDTWLKLADLMEKELMGNHIDPTSPISKRYRVKEATIDNLDFVQLYADAKSLGSEVKPENPE